VSGGKKKRGRPKIVSDGNSRATLPKKSADKQAKVSKKKGVADTSEITTVVKVEKVDENEENDRRKEKSDGDDDDDDDGSLTEDAGADSDTNSGAGKGRSHAANAELKPCVINVTNGGAFYACPLCSDRFVEEDNCKQHILNHKEKKVKGKL
jgi:hypothetical protein